MLLPQRMLNNFYKTITAVSFEAAVIYIISQIYTN